MSNQRELPDVERLTLGAMLERSARVYPSKEAIVFQERRYSYQEYNEIVDTNISGGYNIYPREVEEVLMKHPGVILAACVGVPDDIWGERGRAYIIPKPGVEITPSELKDFCKKLLADYKVPKDFVFKTELPMTPVGKVAKAQLMQEIKDELERATAKSSGA